MNLSKKVCLLGSPGVGKTSLVNQFVRSIFSDKYLTTIGARIDKKQIAIGDTELNMVIWDLAGEDKFESIRGSYLRGAAGYFLVVDGCRRETLWHALEMKEKLSKTLSSLPFVCVINKSDLEKDWEVTPEEIENLSDMGWHVCRASAMDSASVEHVFTTLGRAMLSSEHASCAVS